MSKPQFQPGQEVSDKLDCYRMILEALEFNYKISCWLEEPKCWNPTCPESIVVHHYTKLRREPNPPKPIVVSVDGVLGRDALLPNDRLTAKVLAMFHDARLINPANTYTGQRATLTLAIYPEGCEVLDTVTVPRAVVEEILEWRQLLTPGYCEAFDKLAEAVKGGA